MGIAQLLLPFLATWAGIHLFLFLLKRFVNRPNIPVGPGSGPEYELLPTATTGVPPPYSKTPSSLLSGLSIKPFFIRFSTTSLNSFFFQLGNSPRLSIFWRIWYGTGVLFGLLAMIAGWTLLLYAAIKLLVLGLSYLLTLWPQEGLESRPGVHENAPTHHFRKRNVEAESVPQSPGYEQDGSDMVLVPVIPGITLPLSHLPYYLIALLVSGVVHEAGHAIAAGREKTQILSSGIVLYILYPGAFVDISARALAAMSPIQQLRVVCAGVWNNVVLFLAAWIFLMSGALQLSFRIMGWAQMNNGLTVVDIAPTSPLSGHLQIGSIVTKIDDVVLAGDPLEVWSKTLLVPEGEQDIEETGTMGFCVPQSLLFVKTSDCCLFSKEMPFGHSNDMSLSCFTPFDPLMPESGPYSPSQERVLAKNGQCLPSVDILGSTSVSRCTPEKPTCDEGYSCYRPFNAYSSASMIRIHYVQPLYVKDKEGKSPEGQTVLYQGDKKDVWEAVKVTSIAVRWSFLPLGLPNAMLLTIQYTMSFSLALSILNIVPARHLDGHHALKSLVALLYSIQHSFMSTQSLRTSLGECLLGDGSVAVANALGMLTAQSSKGSRIVRGIVTSTTVLLSAVIVGSLIQMVVTVVLR